MKILKTIKISQKVKASSDDIKTMILDGAVIYESLAGKDLIVKYKDFWNPEMRLDGEKRIDNIFIISLTFPNGRIIPAATLNEDDAYNIAEHIQDKLEMEDSEKEYWKSGIDDI